MTYFSRMRLFRMTAIAIFVFFMGLMILVTFVAHARRSGVTGIDTAKIQQMRVENDKSLSKRPPE